MAYIASMRFSLRVDNNQADAGQDGRAVLRDQILRRERGQGNINFPSSEDHEQVGKRLIYTILYKVWDDYI